MRMDLRKAKGMNVKMGMDHGCRKGQEQLGAPHIHMTICLASTLPHNCISPETSNFFEVNQQQFLDFRDPFPFNSNKLDP